MLEVSKIYDCLVKKVIDFFTGVPDSLLKNFCAYITDNVPANKHIISANEGSGGWSLYGNKQDSCCLYAEFWFGECCESYIIIS